MNNIFSRLIILFLLLGLCWCNAFAQNPVQVQVNVSPPYPIRLSDFTDIQSNVLVTLQNTHQAELRNVFLTGVLRNEDTGATISTDPNHIPFDCINLPPGATMLSGIDLEDLFNPDNLLYRGLTVDQIRGDQALPEGRYTLCLRVRRCEGDRGFLSDIPVEPFGCGTFEVQYVDPPVLTAPLCEENIPADHFVIPIMWMQIIPASAMGSINYTINMVEVEDISRNPFDAMQSSPIIFTTTVTDIQQYNLQIPHDVLLEHGSKYAIQVVASDESGNVVFKNNGKSEVCAFTFGAGSSGGGSLQRVSAVYPADGDVIPFSFFPFIVRYDDYSNAYSRFESDVTIRHDAGTHDTHSRDLGWSFGPMESQRRATGFSITEEQAQHIAVYKNQTDGTIPPFDKKFSYRWEGEVRMEENGNLLSAPIESTSFKVGMSPSTLELPANNSTVPPGDITFRWLTAKEPTRLFPGRDIVQADRTTGGTTFFNGFVDERWVIEVSRDEFFSTILETISGRVGGDFDLFSDESAVKAALYKNEEEVFNITENGRYYWRVRWMVAADNPGDNNAYASSPVWQFVIGEGGDTPVADGGTPPDEGACVSNCIPEVITDRTAVGGLAVGSDVTIGKFTLNVRTLTNSAGNRFTGEGVVTVPFLNNVKILVEFNSIQINAAAKVFDGTVTAKEDRAFVTEDVTTRIGEVLSMNETETEALHSFIEDGDRVASFFSGSSEIGMPIGIDKEIDGKKYIIGITALEFKPDKATLDAVMRMDFPEIGDYVAAFGVKDLCINPNGLGDEGRLYLARDLVMIQEGETRFAFTGSESADTTQATYVSWDCRGFKCMQIRGQVTFPRDMLVPDNADGTIGEGNVRGTFGIKTCRGGNWIASIAFDPFQVKGLTGWGWNSSTAYLDFSDVENPPGFRLPSGYGDPTITDARLVATWQGFYMERIQLRMPPEFASDLTPDGRTAIGVEGVIIDRTGLTASVRGYNLLEISEGNFEGWGFAIDTVNIDFVSNTFTEAGMAGRLGMPIFEEGDHLKYKMALGFDNDSSEFSYQFRVYTRDTLNIPMWGAAKMFFKPNSSIEIGLNDPARGDHITATLHGGIHLVGDMGAIAAVNFRGINFEGLYLSTHADADGRYFSADSIYFAHASPQKSASGFPVNINNINLNLNALTRPGINFDLQLMFSEGSTSIGADATFGVFATFEKVGDNFNVGFGGVDVERIAIDVDVSAMHLQGELEFYRDDPVYGNGTRGSLTVTLPMEISGSLTAYFGTVGGADRGAFGTANYYPYWLVDGMITFPGLPIFSGFAIYGFGGGAYYHMTMASDALPDPQSTTSGSGGRTSIRYVPNFNTLLGLKFAAVLGTHPSSEAFNMDVRLAAEFNSSFGLNFISVGGDGYFMASISERGDAKVWANVSLVFDNRPAEGPKFTGNFDVFVRVGDFVRGVGAGDKFVAMEMYVDKHTWHFYMGTPTNRSGLIADIKVVQATLTSYLMVGHGIPVDLPPLPDRIMSVLGGTGGRLEGESQTVSEVNSRKRTASDEAAYNSGQGFAFGTALALDADFDLGIFYAMLGIDLGFDLNFSKAADGAVFCAETGAPPRGIDGWYIRGQVFAGLYGEMGVQVNLFFVKGRFPIIQMAAAAVMQGNFPDPTGFRGRAALQYSILNGMVEGRCNFEMSIGDKCTMVTPNPLSGMDFIADVAPDNSQQDMSCFTSPAVSFNLPVDRLLEFPVEAADGSAYTRTFYPYVHVFEVRKTGSSLVIGRREFTDNNTVLKFILDEMLIGNSNYDVRVIVRAREHFANGSVQAVRNSDGSTWEEERTVRFTTGPEPDFIPLDQVVYTYPVEGQYYFLKGEGARTVQVSNTGGVSKSSQQSTGRTSSTTTVRIPLEGVMQLQNPVNRIFLTEIDGQRYKYLIRYVPVGGGDDVELDLHYSTGRTMTLPMPTLENETMYGVQLVRKLIPDTRRIINATEHRSQVQQTVAQHFLDGARIRELLGGSMQVKITGKNVLPGQSVDAGEKLLYKFYFRTSRHNTLQEKVRDVTFTSSYRNMFIAESIRLSTRLSEPFDEFEINGLYKNGRQVLKPLLMFRDPWTASYHRTLANPGIFTVHRDFRSVLSGTVRTNLFTARYHYTGYAALNRHGKGLPPNLAVEVSEENSVITGEIERWQVEREASDNPEYQEQNSSGTTSNGQPMFAGATANQNYAMSAAMLNSGSYSQAVAQSLPNFTIDFMTSTYVWLDLMQLQRSVSHAMVWRPYPSLSVYPVRDNLNRNTPLRNRVNSLLRKTAVDFKFRRGQYQIVWEYRLPRGNHLYQQGTNSQKSFTY